MNTYWEETTDLNKIAQAFKDGREVNIYDESLRVWGPAHSTNSFYHVWIHKTRIAVPPVKRPWKYIADVPLNCWIRRVGSDFIQSITAIDDGGIYCAGCKRQWRELTDSEWSTDRKTWHPCTVEEPA